jgi:hypothetical protein
MSIRAARPRLTALENGRARAADTLWRLYFETGHWRGGFLIDRVTGSGRDAPLTGLWRLTAERRTAVICTRMSTLRR